MSTTTATTRAVILTGEALEGEERILRRGDVCRITGISDTQIWRLEQHPDPAVRFPARLQISPGLVGWLASSVYEYLRTRPAVTGRAK